MEIFKYRSAGTIISERDQKSIFENSFWFSKLEHLNDPMLWIHNIVPFVERNTPDRMTVLGIKVGLTIL